ncbi:MAG: NmrA family NAD(P)-binding protein [Ideonella sp.]|nr:NmrA family NAD(P)-binding protein [Ideonella sp.]
MHKASAKFLVMGATGKTGRAVVEALRGQDWPVRAVVHRVDARSDSLARLGAEICVADLHDAEQLTRAAQGTQRAYFVPPFQPHATQAAAAFAIAAREARLEVIVQLSQWLSHPRHPSIMTRETWLTDQLLAMIPGVSHVIVNPGMFADNFLRTIDFASLLGVFPVLTGDSQSAPVSNEDIGRVVAALLVNPRGHEGRRHRPTGPALLSGRDMAAILSRVLGHPVRAVDLPFWLFSKAARQSGASLHEVYNYREYVRDHRAGAFSMGGGITSVVADLTGQPAEDFETIARRYAALPLARPTAGRRVAALARMLALPLAPGHDLEAHERAMQFPRPEPLSLASEDLAWKIEHGVLPATATLASNAAARTATPTREPLHA